LAYGGCFGNAGGYATAKYCLPFRTSSPIGGMEHDAGQSSQNLRPA
jgi:hypothetical protein